MSDGVNLRQVYVNVKLKTTLTVDYDPVSYGLDTTSPPPPPPPPPSSSSTSSTATRKEKHRRRKKGGEGDQHQDKEGVANKEEEEEKEEKKEVEVDEEEEEEEQPAATTAGRHSGGFGDLFGKKGDLAKRLQVTEEKYELKMCNLKYTVAHLKNLLGPTKKKENVNDDGGDSDEDDVGFVRKAPLDNPNDKLLLIAKYTDMENVALVLKYKNDVMDDTLTLGDYDVSTNVYGYVEFDLDIIVNHGAPPKVTSLATGLPLGGGGGGSAPGGGKSNESSEKGGGMVVEQSSRPVIEMNTAWEPLAREPSYWPVQAGPPIPKPYLLHGIRCGGASGVLRILLKWSDHARNVEESLWSLIVCGAQSETGVSEKLLFCLNVWKCISVSLVRRLRRRRRRLAES